MTDTEPKPQGDIEAVAGNQYVCQVPGCDRSFPSPNGLQGHMIAHRPPVYCPECSKEYKTPGALGNHRKTEHGVQSKLTPRQEKRTRRQSTLDWDVDEIITPVLQEMYPSGQIPIALIPALLHWREATVEFLEKAQTE